jgi:phosphomannomutase
MKPEKVFKRYDIRGKYPEEVNEEFTELIGKAIGTFALRRSTGKVVFCRDNKDSSVKLKKKLVDGVSSTGATVLDPGKGPTDYAALAGKQNDAVAVQVTSSHLPLDTNGFKFMYPEGNGFVNEDLNKVKQFFRDREFEEELGTVKDISITSKKRYKKRVEQYFNTFFDSIDRKIVYDSMGGAGSIYLPELFEEFEADLIDISTPEKKINPPDPKPENLKHLEERVEEENAELGLATDMDADRVALYHGNEWVSGNDLFAIFVELLKPQKVVASIDTSQKVEKAVSKYGEISYTRVGDPFVVQEMIDSGAEFSAEPNGHYCFNGFVPYNSGILAALLLAAADIDQLRGTIPEYTNIRESIEVESKYEVLEKLEEKVEEQFEIISEVDGIKFRVEGSMVLVRSSGSSHKLRIVADSDSESSARDAVETVKQMIS